MAGGPVGLLGQPSAQQYRGGLDPEGVQRVLGLLGGLRDLPMGLLQGAVSGATAVRDAAMGDPRFLPGMDRDYVVGRAMDLGGMASAGSLTATAPQGALRAGMVRGASNPVGTLKSRNSDLIAWRKANDMETGGFNPGEIWRETGWFRGPKSEWYWSQHKPGAPAPIEGPEGFGKGSGGDTTLRSDTRATGAAVAGLSAASHADDAARKSAIMRELGFSADERIQEAFAALGSNR
jgi:hypothetical protein